jgi:putative hydrolase of the HAD superfamily
MLSTLFFDAAGTLITPYPSVGAHYASLASHFGLEPDPDALEAGFRTAFRSARRALGLEVLPYGRTHDEARAFWRPIVGSAFAHAGHSMPADPYFDTVYDHFATAAPWRLYDDTFEAIALARAHHLRIGLLSNFDPRLRPILSALAITHHFDPLIISCEVGAEKPSPTIFEAARAACGDVAPESIALIGDTPEEDIAGAQRAGWRSCLIDRDGRHTSHAGPRATNLAEAVQCLLA